MNLQVFNQHFCTFTKIYMQLDNIHTYVRTLAYTYTLKCVCIMQENVRIAIAFFKSSSRQKLMHAKVLLDLQ